MRIAIIGGGWVGCHLAYKLKNDHNIHLFEKNELFKSTSYNNQNRLHLGFHYARNYKTRQMCQDTFELFLNDYRFLTDDVPKNIYCIPKIKSIIDYKTYLDIFRNHSEVEINMNELINIEGCFKTNERQINFELSNEFFNNQLKNIIIKDEINEDKLKKLSKEYDLVINATNNVLNKIDNSFYELTLTLLYKKIKPTSFDALTLVDGKFFSIYPYKNDLYTITDVEYTPIYKQNNITDVDFDINIKKQLFENKILNYFPEFLNCFKYDGNFTSIKSKPIDESDDRHPVIVKEDNIISCFTGKIQGIYIIENYINEIINR
jgi:hypothetical protein